MKLGIRDFTVKSGRDSVLKVCAGGGTPKIALGITRLLETLGRDYGIEEPYWGPSSWVLKTAAGESVVAHKAPVHDAAQFNYGFSTEF